MNAMKRSIQLFTAVCFWLLVSLVGAAPAPDITVELTPRTISVDQSARLTVSVEGVRDCQVSIGAIDKLVISHRGAVNNFQRVNGIASASVSHNYIVRAQEPGSYTVSDISVEIDGTLHRAEPVSLNVTARQKPSSDSSGTTAPEDAPPKAFIRFVPAKKTPYLGEIVPVQIKAYFKDDERFDQVSLPRIQAEGLLIDELGRTPKQVEEVIDGIGYRVLVWDSFITGVKEGRLTLQVAIEATNLIPVRRRPPFSGFGSNLFDDDFFGDIFTGYDPHPITATSPETVFNVFGLPAAAQPEGFTGAVGNFKLDLEAAPTEVEVGEPITLTMSVSGTGNFSRVDSPEVSDAERIKLYTPHATFTPGDSPHEGVKRFDQAAVITDPAVTRVPPVVFSFFNPDSGTYQTLFSDPVEVSIVPTAEQKSDPPPASVKSEKATALKAGTDHLSSAELLPVKLNVGRLVDEIRPPFRTPAFIGSLGVLLLSIVGLLGYTSYQRLHSPSPERLHQKEIRKCRKKTITLLDQCSPEDPDFPDRARESIEKLIILIQRSGSSSLTLADVVHLYGDDSAPAKLFRLSDQLRYGGSSSGNHGSVEQRVELHHHLMMFIKGL